MAIKSKVAKYMQDTQESKCINGIVLIIEQNMIRSF